MFPLGLANSQGGLYRQMVEGATFVASAIKFFGHGLCLLEWKGRGYDEIAEARNE